MLSNIWTTESRCPRWKKRAWKCIEIKATGTLYTALWCSPCVWLPYTAFPLSHKIKDSQVDFHEHSSNYTSILADIGQFKWPVDFSITLTMTLLEGRSVTSKVYRSPSSATPFLLNLSFLTPSSHYLPFFPTKEQSPIIFTQSLVNDPLIWDVTLFSIL